MRVLVTGANGFIGKNVTERLADSGLEFITLDRDGDVDVKHDLCNPLNWTPALRVDAILHLAASSGVRTFTQDGFENNVNATGNVLEWATKNGVQTIVYSSSSSVYGNSMNMDETSPASPMSIYAQSKFMCERMLQSWAKRENRVGVSMRVFNAIGRYQRQDMFPTRVAEHLHKIMNGQPDELVLFGNRFRAWTHVGDVVNGLWSALTTFGTAKAGTYLVCNLGTNAMLTQRNLISMFTDRVPCEANIVMAEPNPLDVQRTKADIGRFISLFGWFPNPRNVAVGVEELLREHGLTG